MTSKSPSTPLPGKLEDSREWNASNSEKANTESPSESGPKKYQTLAESTEASPSAVPFDSIASKIEVSEAKPPKRPVGRPRKGDSTAAHGVGKPSDSEKIDSAFGSASPGKTQPEHGTNTGATPALGLVSSGIPHDVIRTGIEMPFAMAAASTNFAGFALKRDESAPLVPMADMLAAKYLPSLGPYSIELMFVGSILALAGVKYMAFQEWKKLSKEEKEKMNAAEMEKIKAAKKEENVSGLAG